MKNTRSNEMKTVGDRKYYYDYKTEELKIFTQSGEEFNTLKITKEAWEIDPEEWIGMIKDFQSKDYVFTEKEREEIAEALHNATDWKEARQMKREEERREREKQDTLQKN